jgi:N6-L-threonylcarbamoyladenine synthase
VEVASGESFGVTRDAPLTTIPPTPPADALHIPDIVASFQHTVVETLLDKLIRAAYDKEIGRVALAGGVSANSALRQQLLERGKKEGLEVMIPPLEYSTDNAAMIACAAYYRFKKKQFSALDLKPVASLKI